MNAHMLRPCMVSLFSSICCCSVSAALVSMALDMQTLPLFSCKTFSCVFWNCMQVLTPSFSFWVNMQRSPLCGGCVGDGMVRRSFERGFLQAWS